MFAFFIRYRNVSALVGVLLIQFILLGYQVNQQDDVRLLRVWVVGVISPVQKVFRMLTSELGETWHQYVWLLETQHENGTLRKQVSQLKLENQKYRRTLARVDREDKLATYQSHVKSKTVATQVIGHSLNPNAREVFIDIGRERDVRSGMAVISPEGIVGRVQASYHGTSLVRLIHDPEAGVGVLLSRSRSRGVMQGDGHPKTCWINYIRRGIQVSIGETVYTSGEDRVYPRGLPVGKVIRVETDRNFQKVYLSPFAHLDRLEEVLVVLSGKHGPVPQHSTVQPPQFLMQPPTPKTKTTEPLTGTGNSGKSNGDSPPPISLTEADRVRERYRAVAAAQGHVFGEGEVGAPVPNLNLDLSVLSPLPTEYLDETQKTADMKAPSPE